jgi:hypothetical protein
MEDISPTPTKYWNKNEGDHCYYSWVFSLPVSAHMSILLVIDFLCADLGVVVAFFSPNYLLLLVFLIQKVSIVNNQRKRKRKDKFRMNVATKKISFGVISKLQLMICIY